MLSGLIISSGIAFGKALILKKKNIIINNKKISKKDIKKEINKLFYGIEKSCTQLKIIKNSKFLNINKKDIINNQIMLLKDKELSNNIINTIIEKLFTADAAAQYVLDKHADNFNNIDDIYIKSRNNDIYDVSERLLHNILSLPLINLNNIKEKCILIVNNLKPSEIMQLNLNNVLGLISEEICEYSHTAIIAQTLNLPTITHVNNVREKIKNKDFLILDAINNIIHINPECKLIDKLKKIKNNQINYKKQLNKLENSSISTTDNYEIKLYANINSINDIYLLKNYGIKNIGLCRTEFLFMNKNTIPNEEEQFKTYKKIIDLMPSDSEINIRILDIGGDKELPYINLPKENNPALGCRAIRIGIYHKELLHTQLRAILRASSLGKLRIIYPMIISVEEIRFLKSELFFIKNQLIKEGILIDKDIEIGIMIETPAAVSISHYLAQEVDFFIIGINDLTQYTLAVDRDNKLLSNIYDPMSPSILKFIKQSIDNAYKFGKWVNICGELSSDKRTILILIGMGLNKLSLNINSITEIKKIIRNANLKKLKKITKLMLTKVTKEEIMNLVDQLI